MKGKNVRNLLVFLLVLVFTGGGLFAALFDTVTLTGTVAPSVSITATGYDTFDSLSLENSASVTDLPVVVVSEISNVDSYTVTLKSDNAGWLIHETVPAQKQQYTASYGTLIDASDDVAVSLSVTPQTLTGSAGTAGTNPGYLFINYTVASDADLLEGSYTDVLTFTIAAP